MKKVTLFICSVFLIGFMAKAQAPIQEGEKQVNVGIGLSTFGLPVYGGIEFGIGNNISIGGEASYRKYSKYSVWNPSIITFAAIGNYHFNELLDIPSIWDLYGGLSLGYAIWSSGDLNYSWARGSGIYLVGQVGGRYFVSDNFGINLELGGGNYSGGKLGVTILF